MSKGVVDDLGPLLVKAGNILAPNHFSLAMYGSPVPHDPSSIVAPESEGSQTVAGNLEMPTELDSPTAVGSDGNAADGQETVTTTEVTEELEELEPEVINILIDKGKKLQQYKVVGLHARRYLSESGSMDTMLKR